MAAAFVTLFIAKPFVFSLSSLCSPRPILSQKAPVSRACRNPTCATDAGRGSTTRPQPQNYAASWVVKDFIQSGMNIVLGGTDKSLADAICSSIFTQVGIGQLIDISVRGANPVADQVVKDYELSSDFNANYKGDAVDVYIVGATQVDADLNVVFESSHIVAEKHAASSASKCVVIATETIRIRYANGLTRVPVQCDYFMPNQSVKEIEREDALLAMVEEVKLRSNSSCVADLTLASRYNGRILDSSLAELPGVIAVGMLPQSSSMVLVIVDNGDGGEVSDLSDVYDITGPLAYIQSLSKSKDLKRLVGDARRDLVRSLHQWKDGVDGRDLLQREFRFSNYAQARAFVREAERLGIVAQSFPEIVHVYNRVTVTLRTMRTCGVSKLDIAMARELGATCERLQGCSV